MYWFKSKLQNAELNPIVASDPKEIIHIDYLTIESRKADKDINVLVITNHFTRCVQAFISPSQTAKVTVQTLWNKFFVHYGLPE